MEMEPGRSCWWVGQEETQARRTTLHAHTRFSGGCLCFMAVLSWTPIPTNSFSPFLAHVLPFFVNIPFFSCLPFCLPVPSIRERLMAAAFLPQ